MATDMRNWVATHWFRAVHSAHLEVRLQPDFFLLRLSVATMPPSFWLEGLHVILMHDDGKLVLNCAPHWRDADVVRNILNIRLEPQVPGHFNSFVINDAVPLLPISLVILVRGPSSLSLPNTSSLEAYLKANAMQLDPSDY